jgi:hypothetical protein
MQFGISIQSNGQWFNPEIDRCGDWGCLEYRLSDEREVKLQIVPGNCNLGRTGFNSQIIPESCNAE